MVAAVSTQAPDGSDLRWLDEIGEVSGLTWTHEGGPTEASLQLQTPITSRDPALRAGRKVLIWVGAFPVWSGRVDKATPGEPWQLDLLGVRTFGNDFRAIPNNAAIEAGNAYLLNSVVDQAILRGLPWVRRQSLPVAPDLTEQSAKISVSAAIDKVTEQLVSIEFPLVWHVGTNGELVMVPPETAVSRLAMSVVPPGGSTIDGYASDMYVSYVDDAQESYGVRVAHDAVAAARHGRVEGWQDETSNGRRPAPTAQSIANGKLQGNNWRTSLSGDLVVAQGELLGLGGAPVDLAVETDGRVVQLLLADPDRSGQVDPGGVPVTRVVRTKYDEDSQTLTMTPAETVRSGLIEILAGQGIGRRAG